VSVLDRIRPAARAVRALGHLLRLEFPLALPPWSALARDTSPQGRLRRRAVRIGGTFAPLGGPRGVLVAHGVYWHVKALVDATVCTARFGTDVRRLGGLRRHRQWTDALRLAYRLGLSPTTYFLYRLWEPDARLRPNEFVQVEELGVLEYRLGELAGSPELIDKVAFSTRCAAVGLPTPELVAALHSRSVEEWRLGPDSLPPADVFVKPIWGSQGAGGERWRHRAGRWERRGRSMTAAELVRHVRSTVWRRPMMIERCLSNHPELAALAPDALCSFRVMTWKDPGQPAEVLGVTLKLPAVGADVDNLHAGGLACAVDPHSGELGPGFTRRPSAPARDRLPGGGSPISGRRLTVHRAVIELAQRAHAETTSSWSVGWDVAMTPDGPVLIEGNAVWGVDLLHVPHRVGLDPVFAEHLLQRLDEGAADYVPQKVR
jgi:hypothetical protein